MSSNASTLTSSPPTPATQTKEPRKPDDQSFRHASVCFAVDVSGSTYGPTLAAEKLFIRRVSDLLSLWARLSSHVLPWDDRAHPILSLAQVGNLEDGGGTDPGALLTNAAHKAALKESSLWFLMTDGLVPPETRAKFARDIATHGVHSISCIIVIFGNPNSGPESCDISVGVGVFAVVPNCAFLFCNEINGDLRVMQTKGTFDVLLGGKSRPVFDSSSRWDSLPQVAVTDFAAVVVPQPRHLGATEVALQDSLVIDMNDLFANRLSPDQVTKIFSNVENLDSVRMTMQARDQQADFRHWLHQQTIPSDDVVFQPRRDHHGKAEHFFTELVDLVCRGQPPPPPLQARLRAAYRKNMRLFVADAQAKIHRAKGRRDLIENVSANSFSPIDRSPGISPSIRRETRNPPVSAPTPARPEYHPYINPAVAMTPQEQADALSPEPPGAPSWKRQTRHSATTNSPQMYGNEVVEERWGNWEVSNTDASLRGLLYTLGLRSTKDSFKGTCPLCGARNITLAWLFRASASSSRPRSCQRQRLMPPTPPGGTEGFPPPDSRTRLAFPLAMGHFTETAGVLAPSPFSIPSTPILSNNVDASQIPTLVCDPCSVMYTRTSYGITAALPLVRFADNRESMCNILATAFERRFSDDDLSQVFLSVLMLAAEQQQSGTSNLPSTPGHGQAPDMDPSIPVSAMVAAAAAARTFRAAMEWTVRDLMYSVMALRELSESFSLPSDSPGPRWPLATVLAGSFEELDSALDSKVQGLAAPLLRYPLPGFITILKAAPLLNVDIELRRRAAFRRLLYLICEELDKAADQVPHSQSVAGLFGGLLGRQVATGTGLNAMPEQSQWTPVPSISIQALRFTSLLSATSYNMLSRTVEFKYLEESSSAGWVGPAIALFLHGLFSFVTNKERAGVSETFHAVTSMRLVGNALLRPEEVQQQDVLDIFG